MVSFILPFGGEISGLNLCFKIVKWKQNVYLRLDFYHFLVFITVSFRVFSKISNENIENWTN